MKLSNDYVEKINRIHHVKKVGISGGTFDPIHLGHLITAEYIREHFGLDEVLFIPVGDPPHKKERSVTAAPHRLAMTGLAIGSNPYFTLSDMEVDRQGYTYAVDTLKELKSIYGQDTRFFYIIGADVALGLLTWKDYREVMASCSFIAVVRPGFRREDLEEQAEMLRRDYSASITLLDAPQIEISSTKIRERLLKGKSIRYLVPEGVLEYIEDNRLYVSSG